MISFKNNLEEKFNVSMDDWDSWVNLSGTYGWSDSLKVASNEHMPEIFDIWDKLDWWSSDLFDGWLIDCAEYLDLCRKKGDFDIE